MENHCLGILSFGLQSRYFPMFINLMVFLVEFYVRVDFERDSFVMSTDTSVPLFDYLDCVRSRNLLGWFYFIGVQRICLLDKA